MVEKLSALKAHSDALTDRRVQAETRASELKGMVSRGELELETLREEAHRRRSRLESLGEIQARYESFQRGVRAIMQRAKEGQEAAPGQDTVGASAPWSMSGVRGVVADIVQPPPELETAVEAVLGERLGNIIVESHEVGVEAIDFLKSQSEGRSSFIPMGLRGPPRAGRPGGVRRLGRRPRRGGPGVHGDAVGVADGRGRARADAGADRLRPAVRPGGLLPAGRRAGGGGPAPGPGAVARDPHQQDHRHPGRRGDRSAGRRHRRLA